MNYEDVLEIDIVVTKLDEATSWAENKVPGVVRYQRRLKTNTGC